ncbi:MAG: MFS transporter [Planctomycetota bacterium]|nr:MAG: MFS transporter [Planctomycetota bacterium]
MWSSVWGGFPVAARRFLWGGVLLELGHAFLWALQNLYVRSLGFGEEEVGEVLMSSGVGIVLATVPSAWAYDRLGPRRTLLIAGFAVTVTTVGLVTATTLPMLCLWSGALGASFMLHRVIAAPFLSSVSEARQRTQLFSAEFATHTVASVLGLSVAGLIARWFAAGGLPETEALRSTLFVAAALGGASTIFYRKLPGRSLDEVANPFAALLVLKPKHWHMWWRFCVPHVLVGLGAGLTIPFINLYFTDRFGLDTDAMGFVMAASQVTMTVGILGMPRIVARYGMLRGTILTECLSLPFFLILAVTHHFTLAIVAFVFRAALMNLAHPMWRNLMMDVTPRQWRAGVNGISMLAWNGGWAASNRLGGWIIEHSEGWVYASADGYVLPMLITTAAYLLAIGLELKLCWHWRDLGKETPPTVVAES